MILSEQDKVNAILQEKKIAELHQYMKLHKRWLHPGQWKIARALFADKKQVVQVQCGRKLGKSETAIYCAIRYGLENPGSIIYIIANTRKQGVGIYWTSQRLQRYAPKSLIHDVRETDYRLILESANDEGIHSQIIVEGCDNEQSLRGLNPDFVIYEEFRDHNEVFDVEVMRPNLAAKKASLLVISTPPDNECYYTKFTKEVQDAASKPDSKYFYYEAPTSDNPHISKEWLLETQTRLFATGQQAVWYREFEGKYVQGGATAVLPVWHKKKKLLLKPYSFLKEYVRKDWKKIDWYTFSDPGQSTFAVLLFGHHRHTGQLLFFDEVYEKDREKTSAGQIWHRVIEKRESFIDVVDKDDWRNYYDPAASWFQVDVWDRFQEVLNPAKKRKAKNEKDLNSPISRVKDFFNQKDAVWIGSNCVGFIQELDTWSYTKDGKLPDVNDHCLHPNTLVNTSEGQIKIVDLVGKTGKVLSLNGYEDFSNCRQTSPLEDTYKVLFEDGSFICATKEHKFLTSEGWKPLQELTPSDRVLEYVDRASSNRCKSYLRDLSGVFRDSILSLWQVFQFSVQGGERLSPIASSSLGVCIWQNSKQPSCPSQRRGHQQQFNRELRAVNSEPTQLATHASTISQGMGNAEYADNSSCGGEEVAWLRRGAKMALGNDDRSAEKEKRENSDRIDLYVLPVKIQRLFLQAGKVLLSKLLAQSGAPWIDSSQLYKSKKIQEITFFEKSPVYCLEVPTTNAFSVGSGVIVHNCIDLLLYIFNNVHISVNPEVEITLEDKLEYQHSIRVATLPELIKDSGLQKDSFMMLGNSLYIEEETQDDWSNYGGSYNEPAPGNRLSKKRAIFPTDVPKADGKAD